MSKDKVPVDSRLLGTMWLFKVKKKRIFKARLVAQGFAQIPGIDRQIISRQSFTKLNSELFWFL